MAPFCFFKILRYYCAKFYLMKRFLRIALIGFSTLFLIIAGFLTYIKIALPNVGPAPDLKIEATETRLQRGAYLANAVSVCMDCHSTRDWTKFSGPLKPGTLGVGGEVFNQDFGFPGVYYSKNITPHALANWTDGEIFRAITSGVSKDGSPLFPVMPHPNYGRMDKEDIYSIIVYLRSLKPIPSEVPASSSDFPMNFIIHTIPAAPAFTAIPDTNNLVAYGKYLFNAAACDECHTKSEKGQKIAELALAGGFEFPMPGGILRSPNITPDVKTGIGTWSEEAFIKRFKAYADSAYVIPNVEQGAFNTVMPWMMYSQMKAYDLKALYAYLRTVKPIEHQVIIYTRK